jgi:hypothetical protein
MQGKKIKGRNKCFREGEEMSYHLFGVGGGKKKSVKVEFIRWKNPP